MKKFGNVLEIVGTIWIGTGFLWFIVASMNVTERSQRKTLEAEETVNNIRYKLMAERIAYLEEEAIKTRKRTSLLG